MCIGGVFELLLNSTARSLVAALLSIATAKSAVGKLFHSVIMDSFEGRILAFFLAAYPRLYHSPHKFSRGDAEEVKANKDGNVNVEVYEGKD